MSPSLLAPRRLAAAAAALLLAVAVALPSGPAPAAAQDGTGAPVPPAGDLPLPALDGAAAPPLDPAALSARLAPLLADPALGPNPGAAVLDGASGQGLLDARSSAAMIPASTLKVATGLTALTQLGPQRQVRTVVVRNADGSLVLVGGGDPTLQTLPPKAPGPLPAPATLAALADATAAALRQAGTTSVAVHFDNGLFQGPATSPDWDPSFVEQGIVMPVSALTLDPASADIDQAALRRDPAGTAADWFARRLSSLGIAVTSVSPATAEPAAPQLAEVRSPPLAALVDRMLGISDNDVAEALFRLSAIAAGLPATFDSGARVVTDTITTLGIPVPGLLVRDGSGLSRNNRLAPVTLGALLQRTADDVPDPADTQPAEELASTSWLPSGLPVAALTGSLAERFETSATEAGAGWVRAKTGTLTGVTSLAGVVATDQGRPVVFAVIGNGTADTVAARTALDRIAAALASCGCAAGSS